MTGAFQAKRPLGMAADAEDSDSDSDSDSDWDLQMRLLGTVQHLAARYSNKETRSWKVSHERGRAG